MFWTRFVERTVVRNVKKGRLELCIANSFSHTFFCFRDSSIFRTACLHYRAFCSIGMHVVVFAPALSGVFSNCTAAKQAENGAETDGTKLTLLQTLICASAKEII